MMTATMTATGRCNVNILLTNRHKTVECDDDVVSDINAYNIEFFLRHQNAAGYFCLVD